MWAFLSLAVFSFLLGSIPFGVIFTRGRGIDLKKTGSGNIGATNVMRTAGKGAALLTLSGDMLKGTACVALGRVLGVGDAGQGMIGLLAILGHDYSIFYRFKGGKGVATSLGVLLIYMPLAGLISIGVWLGSVFAFRYSSLGALISFVLLPVISYAVGYDSGRLYISIVISALIVLKHTENIKRLIRGEEGKVGQKT